MDLSKKQTIRLEEKDEYLHPIEAHPNFNESMYINCFDPQQKMGGWFRVGNRPNEGHAEMSVCIYLPDGSVGFMFQRPELNHNKELNAAGLKFEVITPFKHLRVTYSGTICLLKNPSDMNNPKQAFLNNPMLPCQVSIDFTGISPMFGGEAVDDNGNPIEENPEEAFARAHYEQHMAAEGSIQIGDAKWNINAFGLRDHSWGPRYWQNLYWYRWLPMNFGRDFAMNISIVTMRTGNQYIWGMVLEDGKYELVETSALTTIYDLTDTPVGWKAIVKTAKKEYEVNAKVLSQIPLRNRRQRPDGTPLNTRIIEGFTEMYCNGMVGYGMSEYLDQIENNKIVGRAC